MRVPHRDLSKHEWTVIEYGLIAALVIYSVYFLTGFRFDALISGDTRQVDFRMWYLLPPQIRARDYPSAISGDWTIPFAYLPSAVAMLLPLSLMGQVTAFIVWMVLQGISLAVVLWASLSLAGMARSHLRLPIAIAAIFVTGAAIEWDMRAHNNNLIYLALIMLGLKAKQPWVSAVLWAVTTNLKLYSAVLIPGLLWRREYRLAVMTASATLAIGIILPLLVFGYANSIRLHGSWFNVILYTMSPDGLAAAPLSLQKTSGALLAAEPTSSIVIIVSRTLQALWLLLVLCYFVIAAKRDTRDGDGNVARLCDFMVMLMLPLPISSWLVPYHGIVMLPAFILIVSAMIEVRHSILVRALAGIAVVGCITLRFAIPAWNLRAGTLLLSLVLTVLALGAIRMSPYRAS